MNAWELPIDLLDHDVLAILAGEKTQIRQIMQFQPNGGFETIKQYVVSRFNGGFEMAYRWVQYKDDNEKVVDDGALLFTCPFGCKDQILYVREPWAYSDADALITHRATLNPLKWPRGVIWQPSETMPRIGCRLGLRVERVFIERLKDISEDDANAEGVRYWASPQHDCLGPFKTIHEAFKVKWCAEHGAESWDKNPFVFACEVKRIM